jgi:hypothetical protein
MSSTLCFRGQHTFLSLKPSTRSDLRLIGRSIDGLWLVFISLRVSMLLSIKLPEGLY